MCSLVAFVGVFPRFGAPFAAISETALFFATKIRHNNHFSVGRGGGVVPRERLRVGQPGDGAGDLNEVCSRADTRAFSQCNRDAFPPLSLSLSKETNIIQDRWIQVGAFRASFFFVFSYGDRCDLFLPAPI